jgi:hypothetical protein
MKESGTGTAMALKPEQTPALTHDERVQRLQQLTADLAKAVDLAEEQRRILRDLARDANELADSLTTAPEPPADLPKRRKR